MRILLVEDDPTQAGIFAAFLRREGHEVDEVASRDKALTKMEGRSYDVAVVDLVLVTSTGDTIAEEAYLKGMGVVVMSAANERFMDDLMETLKLKNCSVSCTLIKPFPPAMLLVAVNKAYADKSFRGATKTPPSSPEGGAS